jgi:hypothetical protein
MIFSAAAGLLLIVATLWEAFETIILPRRVTRRFRFTRLFYRTSWLPWRALARQFRVTKRREGFLSIYGPLSLLFLFTLWAFLLIVGFGLLDYAHRGAHVAGASLETCLYLSGTTFFTLGLGDVTPQGTLERILAVVESGIGFGFLALVLSYLPVIYQAFSRREVSIILLDARAGSPPTATELLRRHTGPDGRADLQKLLHEWERWSAEILESHVSYPVVSYFRSQHNNESWLGALAAILDTCSLLISGADDACARQARLTFAMCRHTVVDLAQVFFASPLQMPDGRLPASELARLRSVLTQAGIQLRDTPESNNKLIHLREMYEPYLQALAAFLYMELPPWILAKEITDNWKTSAWGRIAGFTSPAGGDLPTDDHSE